MPARWKLFKLLCILQLIGSTFLFFYILINVFRHFAGAALIGLAVYGGIILLAILGINLVDNNLPATPVTGGKKRQFNRLFLFNFFTVIYLFANLFNDLKSLKSWSVSPIPVPESIIRILWVTTIADLATLLFQLLILYGLFVLRREVYAKFMSKTFEFEQVQSG